MATCESAAQPGSGPGLIGQALVPYYRQILPVLNIFIRKNGTVLNFLGLAHSRESFLLSSLFMS